MPDITSIANAAVTGFALAGSVPTVGRWLRSQRIKPYRKAIEKALPLVDTALALVPSYEGSIPDQIIDLAIVKTSDGSVLPSTKLFNLLKDELKNSSDPCVQAQRQAAGDGVEGLLGAFGGQLVSQAQDIIRQLDLGSSDDRD